MRANYRMQRLHVTADLALNEAFEATAEQQLAAAAQAKAKV